MNGELITDVDSEVVFTATRAIVGILVVKSL